MAILSIWDGSKEVEIPIADPTLYLLLDGTRAMTGALDMGANAIANVGNVDGRDVSVDGAKLDIALTAAAAIADHAIVRGDGGARGVQGAIPTISDAGDLNMGGKDILYVDTMRDLLGNEQLGFGFVVAAVNYLTIFNSQAGLPPSFIATGSDANIDLALGSKGTGKVKSLDHFDVTGDITLTGTVDGIDIAGTVVTAAAVIADNCLVRGNGGARGVQNSGVIVSDANAMSGVTTLTCSQSIISPAIFGGTGAGDDLTLVSTSDATTGKIYFGAPPAPHVGVFDEANGGKLGIGTTDPHSYGSNIYLAVHREAATVGFVVAMESNTASNSPMMQFKRSRGTESTKVAVQSGDRLGLFLSAGWDGATFRFPVGIVFEVDGAVSSGNVPTAITFETGVPGRTERMRIQSDGDILVDSGTSMFVRDSALGFNSSADGQFDLFADTEVEITTPLIDLNAASIFAATMASGADQAAAGAAAGELYVDTNDDNTVKRGV